MDKSAPHILIVDDEYGIRAILLEWFEKRIHFTAIAVSCAVEALEHMERESFDAVITGINQPEMDGLEMTALIRRWAVRR